MDNNFVNIKTNEQFVNYDVISYCYGMCGKIN